jgi:hypothetical protein
MKRLFTTAAFVFLFIGSSGAAESLGVSMRGPNEVPPGDPDGAGYADLILDGTTLSYSVIVFNIDTPTAMHIHPGRRGETGPPMIPIATPFVREEGCPSLDPAPCTARFINAGQMQLTANDAALLLERPADFYLNVHNAAHPAGAVRGQVQYARYLPVVGQTPGAAGTNWFTRFAVLNRSIATATPWEIEFFPQSPNGNTSRSSAAQTSLAPLNLQFTSAFPIANFTGIGTARILSDLPVEATASIFNGEPGGRGDFSFAVEGLAIEDARRTGVLVDLTTSSDADLQARTGHRTNVGWFNPQVQTVVVAFRAFSRDGSFLGERRGTIPPGGRGQSDVWALINEVAASQRVRDSFWISWESSLPIFVYATVVNNETGDAEYRD